MTIVTTKPRRTKTDLRSAARLTMGQMMAEIGEQNRRAEAARPAPTAEKTAITARFLYRWCKGKPVVRQDADSTFWRAGGWMTKIDAQEAEAVAATGLFRLEGDPRRAGARLVRVPR